MSCNFSDRFFVMNCGLCISGLLCQRKHSYSYSYSYSRTRSPQTKIPPGQDPPGKDLPGQDPPRIPLPLSDAFSRY